MASDSSSTPRPSSASASASSSKPIDQFLSIEEDQWEYNHFEFIFQVTFDPERNARAKTYTHLQTLAAELLSESEPICLSAANLERFVVARLAFESNSEPSAQPLFDYLVDCWKRCNEIRKRVFSVLATAREKKDARLQQVETKAQSRLQAVEKGTGFCVSYAGLVLNPEMADIFVMQDDFRSLGAGYIGRKLLLPTPDQVENAIPKEFLTQFLERFENDGLDDILRQICSVLAANMREQNVTKSSYLITMRAIALLLSFKQIANLLSTIPTFNPVYTNAKTIEVVSFLGPFFAKLGIFPDSDPTIAESYFQSNDPYGLGASIGEEYDGIGMGARNPGDVKSAQNSFRTTMASIWSQLFDMTMSMIRSGSPAAKEGVLKFFSKAINLNKPRARIHVDRKEVSSDSFLWNLMGVGLKMCDPFLEPKYSKLYLIDPHYLLYTNRLESLVDKDTTRIRASGDEAEKFVEEWRAANPGWETKEPNFISDAFFLTMGTMHVGACSTIRQYQSFLKELDEMKKAVDKLKAQMASGTMNPLNEQIFKRFQTQFDKMIAHKLAIETCLLDPDTLQHMIRFYHLVAMFLVRVLLMSTSQIPTPSPQEAKPRPDPIHWDAMARGFTAPPQQPTHIQNVDLPPVPDNLVHQTWEGNANPIPRLWGTLPEWILEDVCEFYLFVARFKAKAFEQFPRDEIVTLAMLLLKNPHFVKNPYLKSKLVEILYFFTIPLYRMSNGETSGRLDQVFITNPLAKDHLISSVTRYYIDVEQTGLSSQFYDKFNIRYFISQIYKCVWDDVWHRGKVIESSRDMEQFVRFVNLLINDTTFLLDESLSKLAEINAIQTEMASPEWSTKSPEHQKEREGTLKQLERQASGYMSLGNETVHMLAYLTAESKIVDPFMAPEIVEKLAATLDYNLVTMVGPKSTELKVKNPEKYRFQPKRLLTELIDIYLHLCHRKEFIASVAKDTRSYKKELFVKARNILIKTRLKPQDQLTRLMEFVEQVEKAIQSTAVEEEDLGDIPDEFLDPLMFTLMEDPVILPTSKVTIDRSTIKAHLLSDIHDPFNRTPLSIDMVIPDVELKQKIEQWKSGKLAAKRGGVTPMETD